jgi:FAD/FMN-containing dehydrogenase
MPTSFSPPGFRGVIRADDDARAVYSEAAGIGRALPAAVAMPADTDDLVRLVRWAAERGVALVPRGSGSSMPGGAIGHGVIVDLSRWRELGDVNVPRGAISVAPGALRADVERAARAHGLRFPVDPSSGAFATIGGMVATNAAGAHSMHFGAMRPWVNALECVFADGARAEVRRGSPPPRGVAAIDRILALADELAAAETAHPARHQGVAKDSSGYGISDFSRSRELVDLLVGSEGTLAFFTRIELRLIPAAKATSSVLGAFTTLEDAVLGAQRARASGAVACELLDRTFLDVAASGGAPRQLPEATESALLAEVEGENASEAEARARELERIFQESGATTVRIALDPPTETELWELRHAASPILARLDPALRSMQFIEDCAVPPERLPAYVRGVRTILERHETRGVIFGHAGDAHVHVNPLVDVSRADWRERVCSILDQVVTLAASLGGTLAGEHGDGRLRAPLLPRVWPADVLERFAAVKRAFDPEGVLNPGAKIAIAGEHAIGEIKYDPAAPPLPPKAHAALQRVESERAYARSRLELLDES